MSVDLGTGDGQSVLRLARQQPDRLFIGIDAGRDALVAASQRALRKPQRGGAANAFFVHAAAEALPEELDCLVEHVAVLFPWGSLLRAVAQPDAAVLAQIRRICRPGATFKALVSIDPLRDAAEAARLGVTPDGGALTRSRLAPGYLAAGFRLRAVEPLAREDLAALPSTWAKRLAHGRPRPAWRIEAEVISSEWRLVE